MHVGNAGNSNNTPNLKDTELVFIINIIIADVAAERERRALQVLP